MSEKRLQRDLSKKKSIRVSDGDKDFIGEMAQRINACAEVENETENKPDDLFLFGFILRLLIHPRPYFIYRIAFGT